METLSLDDTAQSPHNAGSSEERSEAQAQVPGQPRSAGHLWAPTPEREEQRPTAPQIHISEYNSCAAGLGLPQGPCSLSSNLSYEVPTAHSAPSQVLFLLGEPAHLLQPPTCRARRAATTSLRRRTCLATASGPKAGRHVSLPAGRIEALVPVTGPQDVRWDHGGHEGSADGRVQKPMAGQSRRPPKAPHSPR